MAKQDRVIICRPEPEASRTAHLVEDLGFLPLIMPALEYLPMDHVQPKYDRYTAVIVTSAAAARNFKHNFHKGTYFAVGQHTAEALSNLGVEDIVVPEMSVGGQALAENLFAVLGDSLCAQPILYIRGADVAFDMGGYMAERNVNLENCITYSTEPVLKISQNIIESVLAGNVRTVMLFSVRTAEAFFALIQEHNLLKKLISARFLCMSDRVAISVRMLLAHNNIDVSEVNIVTSSGQTIQDMLDAI